MAPVFKYIFGDIFEHSTLLKLYSSAFLYIWTALMIVY